MPATSLPYRRFRLAVLLAFFAVRLVHAAQLVDAPALSQQRWAESDMFAFDHWAHNIAAGDWLSRQPQRPVTAWQRDVVAAYLRLEPTDPAAQEAPALAAENLTQRWQRHPVFYQEPLFPYLLAALYAVLGDAPLLAVALQMLVGLLGLCLLLEATRILLGEREAAWVGLLAVACGPLAYYESLLLRETLAITLTWLVVWRWAVARLRDDWQRWTGVGLAAGFALLARSTLLPFVAALVAVSVFGRQQRRERLLGWALGLAVPFSCLALRNFVVGAPLLALNGGSALAVFAANAPGAVPWQGLILQPELLARFLAGADVSPLGALAAAFAAHPDWRSFLALQLAKWQPLLHDFELPGNSSFAFYRQHAAVLRWLPVHFALALPLGLLGGIQAVRQRRGVILAGLAVTALLPLVLLQPVSRYRVGLLAALLPLAAIGLGWLWDLWRRGRRGAVMAAAVALSLFAAWLDRPLPAAVPFTRAVDHAVAWQFWAKPALVQAAGAANHAEVYDTMRLFLRGEPADLATWPRPLRDEQTRIAEIYSEAHAIAAQALAAQGKKPEAASERVAAAALHRLNRGPMR